MDIITILVCIIAAVGFIIGKIIQISCKEEIKSGKKIIQVIQNIIFSVLLVFLFLTFNLNVVIAIILAAVYLMYAFKKKKESGKINLIIVAATIAATFRTGFFLHTASTSFIYTLAIGLKTKEWKTVLKKAGLLLIISVVLIYLRII